MATVLSTLYPPLIDTFMPAFEKSGPAIATFSISPYNTNADIARIHISLVEQTTNLNAFKQNNSENELNLINGVWITSFQASNPYLSYNSTSGLWTIKIPSSLLRSSNVFSVEGYYKLQLRFDESDATIDNSYLTAQRAKFSEWSSVCLLKAVPKPQIVLTNFDRTINGEEVTKADSIYFNPGIIPVAGQVYFDGNISGSYEETLRSYKASIYETENPDNILDSIDTIYTGSSANKNDIYWLADCENAQPGIEYTLSITITTKNQYTLTRKYSFYIYAYDNTPFTPSFNFKRVNLQQYNNLTVDDPDSEISKIITEEDGDVQFTVTVNENMPPGYLYIKRASSLDNYKRWHLISCTRENGTVSRTINDYTVSSLVRYKYSAQFQTKKGAWTKSYQTSPSDIIYPDFYDMLFYRDGKQLAVRYDGDISSLRPVVNRQKIDTLGGKYPKFAENAQMNYKQFSISGLIDAESDFNRRFLDDRDYSTQMNDYNSQMDGKYQIRNDTIADGDLAYRTTTNGQILATQKNTFHDLYPKDNWWLEREFREQATQWLNDGEPKLFRSMPEGNMVVMLTDISLTPHRGTSRRLYSFSATMYEIEDGNSLEVLNSLGIFPIVDEKKIDAEDAGDDSQDDDEQSDYLTRSSIGQFPSMRFPAGQNQCSSLVIGSMLGDASNSRGLDIDYISVEDLYDFIIFDPDSVDGKLYQVVKNSIQLKDIKIRFLSKPKWYSFEGNNINKIDETVENKTENAHLGYKIALQDANNRDVDILVFVNEKGYYQVPSNLKIANIKIYDGAVAEVNYKIDYKIHYNDDKTPSTTKLAHKIVGQISRMWQPNTAIHNLLKEKHKWLKYKQGKLEINEFLNNWHALSLELTPYSVVSISFKNDDGTNTSFDKHVVGRTGIYNLVDDYPINDIIILGKRMVRVDNSRQPFLDDWEFVLDISANQDKSSVKKDITWNNLDSPLVDFMDRTTQGDEEEINRLWNNDKNNKTIELGGYSSISQIQSPKNNTVYGIKDKNDELKYMIYYQDSGWYEVEFEEGTDQNIILAKVPVHGMINYWADIVRQTF